MSMALSFLLLLALIGAGWLFQAWRGAEGRTGALAERVASLEGERRELEKRLEQEGQARRKQAEALAEYRKRSDKAKRRAEKGPELPLGTAARVRDLELELERAQAGLRRSESEREQQARRAEGLERACAALEARLADASGPANALADATRAALENAQSELSATREQLAKQEEALSLAGQNEARMRKRMDNQEQLYASLRAELEVKKDRLRTQEEQIRRLEALRVVVAE
ncbi:MAG: hypothetical protein R3F35_03605 [Myxococcota bacterium]